MTYCRGNTDTSSRWTDQGSGLSAGRAPLTVLGGFGAAPRRSVAGSRTTTDCWRAQPAEPHAGPLRHSRDNTSQVRPETDHHPFAVWCGEGSGAHNSQPDTPPGTTTPQPISGYVAFSAANQRLYKPTPPPSRSGRRARTSWS